MSSNPSYIQLCDINDSSYLYSGNIFASNHNVGDEDVFSLFNYPECFPQSPSDRFMFDSDPFRQGADNEACYVNDLGEFNGQQRKPENIKQSDSTSGGEAKSDEASTHQNSSIKDTKAFRRKDVSYKGAIRLLRRFYRNSFKSQNPEIVQKTYQKCSIEEIYKGVHDMLSEKITDEHLTEDLVYYTIGIIGIKKAAELPCHSEVKDQIASFQRCTKQFSRIRFNKALGSENLKTLARHMIQELDDPKVSIFVEELN
ncbi:unnamed protein product [Moneuplotes crassus]|uniref:Uncharacterized protein n=1 Tax=Euplotes crassus TaxID=5936 RepID=A0AAD1U9J1_EUPCR|nr:unnamed protein product [Moneuplotes crassus]